MPPTKCPVCTKVLDAATSTTGNHKPGPGDVTICIYCQTWLRFTDDLGLRLFRQDDFKDFSEKEVEWLKHVTKVITESMKGRSEGR